MGSGSSNAIPGLDSSGMSPSLPIGMSEAPQQIVAPKQNWNWRNALAGAAAGWQDPGSIYRANQQRELQAQGAQYQNVLQANQQKFLQDQDARKALEAMNQFKQQQSVITEEEQNRRQKEAEFRTHELESTIRKANEPPTPLPVDVQQPQLPSSVFSSPVSTPSAPIAAPPSSVEQRAAQLELQPYHQREALGSANVGYINAHAQEAQQRGKLYGQEAQFQKRRYGGGPKPLTSLDPARVHNMLLGTGRSPQQVADIEQALQGGTPEEQDAMLRMYSRTKPAQVPGGAVINIGGGNGSTKGPAFIPE